MEGASDEEGVVWGYSWKSVVGATRRGSDAGTWMGVRRVGDAERGGGRYREKRRERLKRRGRFVRGDTRGAWDDGA